MTHAAIDPIPFLRGFASLRRLTAMYPKGHPVISQKVQEVFQDAQQQLAARAVVNVDIVHDEPYVDGKVVRSDSASGAQTMRELRELGADSVQIRAGLQADELVSAAEFLAALTDNPTGEDIATRLMTRGIHHISFGRIVPLDTRWRTRQWDDGPSSPDPAYAESIARTEQAFEAVAAGRGLDAIGIRDLVQLLIGEVARSNAAVVQILTLKEYENLTYCHSVNVAILSLMLGRQLELDEATVRILVETALLHDIGKTRVPLEIVKKPGALDRAERKQIEAHTTYGAEILTDTAAVHPLAPTVALEHHRGIRGNGYPDLGDGVIPHLMSQIVSVADIYEALTGARSYREPMKPEQACLVLAREAGVKLNTAFVKAFVAAVTFFPVGSVVRTSREETGIVVRTNSKDPLHPVIVLTNETLGEVFGEADTAKRDDDGHYLRHIVATLPAPANRNDLNQLLESAI